jgi:uncharacterized protein (DUF2141 family)
LQDPIFMNQHTIFMDQHTRQPRRDRRRQALVLSLLLLALIPWPSPAAMTGEIRVKVVGLQSDQGEVRFGLYNKKEGFATKDAVVAKGARSIKDGQCEFVIKDVPYGTYALIVGHDVNKDGKINESPFSAELKGISNYTGKILWFPDFDKARFRLDRDQVTVEIRVY